MTKATFATSVSSDFVLIADGATYSSAFLYSRDEEQIAIAIAAALPAPNSDNYFKLPKGGHAVTLGTGDKLYARSMNNTSMVRGYRDSIA